MKTIALLIPLALACCTMAPALARANNLPHCRVSEPEDRALFDEACAALGITVNDDRCCTRMMKMTMRRVLREITDEDQAGNRHDALQQRDRDINDAFPNRVAP